MTYQTIGSAQNQLTVPKQKVEIIATDAGIRETLNGVKIVELTRPYTDFIWSTATPVALSPTLLNNEADLPNLASDVTTNTLPLRNIGDHSEGAKALDTISPELMIEQSHLKEVAINRKLNEQVLKGTGAAASLSGFDTQVSTTVDAGTAGLSFTWVIQGMLQVAPNDFRTGLSCGANSAICSPATFQKFLLLFGSNVGALNWVFDQRHNCSRCEALGLLSRIDDDCLDTEIYFYHSDFVRLYYVPDNSPDAQVNEYGVCRKPIPLQGTRDEVAWRSWWTGVFVAFSGAISKLINFT